MERDIKKRNAIVVRWWSTVFFVFRGQGKPFWNANHDAGKENEEKS